MSVWNKNPPPADALARAARCGNIYVVKDLLAQGADINGKDGQQDTSLIAAIRADEMEVAKFLIEQGASVNERGYGGFTPLVIVAARQDTAYRHSKEIAALLIEKGAALDDRENVSGNTPLMTAAHVGNENTLRLLLDCGAVLDKKNKEGKTALDLASAYRGESIIQMLRDEPARRQKEKQEKADRKTRTIRATITLQHDLRRPKLRLKMPPRRKI